MRLQQVFDPFRMHGLDVFIPPAIETVIGIMERTLEETDKRQQRPDDEVEQREFTDAD